MTQIAHLFLDVGRELEIDAGHVLGVLQRGLQKLLVIVRNCTRTHLNDIVQASQLH